MSTQKQSFMLYVIPTYDCNLRCDYCFVPKYKEYKLKAEVIQQIPAFIDSFVESKNVTIAILGGEPFFYMETLLDIIRFTSERGYSYEISTNGLLIDKRKLEAIKSLNPLLRLTFSIDGTPFSTTQNRLGGNVILFNKMIENYKLALDVLGYEQVSITMTISPSLVPSFSKDLSYLISLNPKYIRFRLSAGLPWTKDLIDSYLQQFKYELLKYSYKKLNTTINTVIEQFEDVVTSKTVGPCSKGLNLTLTPDGYFVPCYNYLGKDIQDTVKYPYNIQEIVSSPFKHYQGFSDRRMSKYFLTNTSSTETKTRTDYSSCIINGIHADKIDSTLSVWKYKEQEEKKIARTVIKYFYDNYGKNLLELSSVYNKK